MTVGLNYKPVSNLTLKADYTKTTNEAESGNNTWNIGAGWNF